MSFAGGSGSWFCACTTGRYVIMQQAANRTGEIQGTATAGATAGAAAVTAASITSATSAATATVDITGYGSIRVVCIAHAIYRLLVLVLELELELQLVLMRVLVWDQHRTDGI